MWHQKGNVVLPIVDLIYSLSYRHCWLCSCTVSTSSCGLGLDDMAISCPLTRASGFLLFCTAHVSNVKIT